MSSAYAFMANSESNFRTVAIFLGISAGLLVCGSYSTLSAQVKPQGFAVERFYPSAPGSAWFVMDDLNMSGGLGGAVSLIGGYSRRPLQVKSSDGTQPLPLVSDEAFGDIGVAGIYARYRFYLNFPMPLLVNGTSGTV